jgi:hypothetical protein
MALIAATNIHGAALAAGMVIAGMIALMDHTTHRMDLSPGPSPRPWGEEPHSSAVC